MLPRRSDETGHSFVDAAPAGDPQVTAIASTGDRIALFVPTLAGGGAERVMVTLAKGFLQRGYAVDVIVVAAEGPFLEELPTGARLIELQANRVLYSVFRLARYLRRERPVALLATLDTANAVAVVARWISRQSTRVVIRQAYHLTRGWESMSPGLAMFERLLVRWCYPHADIVAAVSEGVAEDLRQRPYMRDTPIHVVPNPIVTSELRRQASMPIDDPWFAAGEPPVILGVGRLTQQKRFDVLIRAFALVRRRIDARLLIFGEGEDRTALDALVRELRLEEVVRMPGFVSNPFSAMGRSRVFVLSSAFEGLPGTLIQALACGTSVVATDCDSGPREILQGGRFGRLVPVGDVTALADAIFTTLEPGGTADGRDASLPYTEAASVNAYAHLLRC